MSVLTRKRGALAVLAALSVAASCVPAGTNEPAGNLATPTARPSMTAVPTEALATPSPPSAYVVGDRIKLGDEEYFGVSEVDLDVPAQQYIGPDPGNKWIAALVEIEGINPDGATYNPFFFKVRDEQGFEYSISPWGKEPQLSSSNDLPPGTKVKGWVNFEVPETAVTFTLEYAPGFFGEPVEVKLN